MHSDHHVRALMEYQRRLDEELLASAMRARRTRRRGAALGSLSRLVRRRPR